MSDEACPSHYHKALSKLDVIDDIDTVKLLVTHAGKTDGYLWENMARNQRFLCVLAKVINQGRSDVVSIFIEERFPALSFLLKAAVFYRQIDIAKTLLDAGTDANDDATESFEDALQTTPLHLAAYWRYRSYEITARSRSRYQCTR